jgi:hypothetical protein
MLVLDMPWSFKLKHSYLVVTENLAFLLWFCSNVNLTLEQLCMEGNRKQAKYAVSAIATLTADSGLKALSVLYGVELTVSVVPSSFFSFQESQCLSSFIFSSVWMSLLQYQREVLFLFWRVLLCG